MKTMKNMIGYRTLSAGVMSLFLLMAACSDTNKIDFTANDNANLQSEANADAQTEETDDMASVAVAADASTLTGREDITGRTEITVSDDRFKCATVTLVKAADNSTLVPHGTITIDFGTGCLGPGGKNRVGKIVVEYKGRRFLPGSKIVTTFVGYSINGIALEGTRTLTNTSASETAPVSFTIAEDGMKLTYPDGTTVTRTATRTRTWNRTANPLEDSWTVTGSATGTNRKGKTYTMTITKDLVYKRSCAITNKVFIPVQGTKELVVDTKKVTIDYGSGACDNTVTITINGKSKDVEPTADGN
ncbi:MAG TPA: hypothetical protein PLX35_16935 [Cyclobacteriaceae bacterium]|nr:hypothetical protein [Cyclobacteriaceae bacterium]